MSYSLTRTKLGKEVTLINKYIMLYDLLAFILKSLVKPVIKKCKPKIIGITGSVGKTSTKDVVFAVLKEKYKQEVWKSYENLNTEIGMPLAILGFKYSPKGFMWFYVLIAAIIKSFYFRINKTYPQILVLEYGADKKGDIEYLTKIARPDIAIITEVGPAHLHEFKTIENVAKEKMYLAKSLNADGKAILNKDNKYITQEAKRVFFDKIWYHGSCLEGAKNVAYEVAKLFKISDNIINQVLKKQISIKGRLNIIDGIRNSVIIDDTYNSNPLSVRLALDKLRLVYKKNQRLKRKIIVLGDMLELGENEFKLHKQTANIVRRTANIFITVGNRFEGIKSDYWFLTPMQAGIYLQKIIKNNDLILIKGSQGIRMEKVIEKIIADKQNMKNFLVRQSTFWKAEKFKQP